MIKSGELEINRKKQSVNWMWALVEEGLKEILYSNSDVKGSFQKSHGMLKPWIKAPTVAAGELLFS